MELYLIRHGQSARNADPSSRIPDPPLTALGERQASCAAGALADRGIVKLYCSPLRRALQTAQLMAGPLNLTPNVFVGLHEWYGTEEPVDPGLTRQQMNEICPDVVLPEEVTDRGWLLKPQSDNRAMLDQAGRDALEFLAHLEERHPEPGERVAAVSHGGFLSTLIGACYGLTADDDPYRFAHQNAAISKVRHNDGRIQLRYMNRLSHLSDDMITW